METIFTEVEVMADMAEVMADMEDMVDMVDMEVILATVDTVVSSKHELFNIL